MVEELKVGDRVRCTKNDALGKDYGLRGYVTRVYERETGAMFWLRCRVRWDDNHEEDVKDVCLIDA